MFNKKQIQPCKVNDYQIFWLVNKGGVGGAPSSNPDTYHHKGVGRWLSKITNQRLGLASCWTHFSLHMKKKKKKEKKRKERERERERE